MSDDNTEPCNCGQQWCTGFKSKGQTRYIIPQHLSGECPDRDETIATLRKRLNDANKALAEEIRRTNDARAEADALRGALRSVLDSADEAVRWMTHVGTVTIDRVGNFEGECECLRNGPDTCDCGSDAIRFAYRRVAKDARQLLKGRSC